MKKIFLLLSLILGMESTFPSVSSAYSDQKNTMETGLVKDNLQDSQDTLALVYKELNSIHNDIESAKDAIKLNWTLWGLGLLTIICSIATIHYAKTK
ncbi:MAG: hypothetical protein Pg6B_10730 [Candidatus Azobacteroides pseudotrichonymphae]|jgi:peptidoglycan hydrolase CwlO-like protein|nr:MAG: hypothetical protein Pg6B_10730 [Candidatus Azobacteroides pseudotrichonymphae]